MRYIEFIVGLFLIIIILLSCTLSLQSKKIKSYFTQPQPQPQQQQESKIQERWKKRWASLPPIDKYMKYFSPTFQWRDFSDNEFQPNKIIVSVASYRDNECYATVKNLSEKADHPENLHIIICQQNDASAEVDCLEFCKKEPSHPACRPKISKISRLKHTEARGPCWARFLNQQQWTGEEYYLQLDAHTRFTPHWDTYLISELKACPHDRCCLTQYPSEYHITDKKKDDEKNEKWEIGRTRGNIYLESMDETDGFTRIQSEYVVNHDKIPKQYPFVAKGWGGCFSFSPATFIKDAGYDPYTQHLFFGEEMDVFIRAWTRGWDFFSPRKCCVFTSFERGHRKTFWENPDQRPVEVLSRFRIYVRLGYIDASQVDKRLLIGMEKFKFGNVRTIEDYEKWGNFSRKKETVGNNKIVV